MIILSKQAVINLKYIVLIIDQITDILKTKQIDLKKLVLGRSQLEYNSGKALKYISKFVTLIAICGDNFPKFCPIYVFFLWKWIL